MRIGDDDDEAPAAPAHGLAVDGAGHVVVQEPIVVGAYEPGRTGAEAPAGESLEEAVIGAPVHDGVVEKAASG